MERYVVPNYGPTKGVKGEKGGWGGALHMYQKNKNKK